MREMATSYAALCARQIPVGQVSPGIIIMKKTAASAAHLAKLQVHPSADTECSRCLAYSVLKRRRGLLNCVFMIEPAAFART